MANTIQRVTIALSSTDIKDIEYLVKYFGESRSQIIKRSIRKLLSNIHEIDKIISEEKADEVIQS